MTWQDKAITLAQLGFILALLPAVFSRGSKPPLATSVGTALGLAVIGYAMLTLGLWASSFSAFVTCALWLVIAGQRFAARTATRSGRS